MCFSPQADLVGGAVLVVLGVDALRHVHDRRDHVPLAALPLLLAAHQVIEAFAWWGLQGVVPPGVGTVAVWVYLFIAFVVLPVYVPIAILVMEPPGRRRRVLGVFVAMGAALAAVLLAGMLRGPVTATVEDWYLSYSTGMIADGGLTVVLVAVVYVVVTCGSVLVSGRPYLVVFGLLNLLAVAVLAWLELSGFVSLWCAWAALTSAGIAVYMRIDHRQRAPEQVAVA